MDIKILSWNVEHFTGDKTGRRSERVARVAAHIEAVAPDVFCIMEVEGARVFEAFVTRLPNYVFSITEGPQTQEILIGVRSGLTAFMTQKNEFKRNNPGLRPGALVTVTGSNGVHLPILCIHLKSLPSPEGFGLRDAMLEKAYGLKRALEGAAERMDQAPRFILVGDLNTMGMTLKDSTYDVPAEEEITRLVRRFKRYGMRPLTKTHDATFNNGSTSSYAPADLDHVFATDNLDFSDQGGAEVHVGGWAIEPDTAAQDDWIARFSDHAPLVFQVRDI